MQVSQFSPGTLQNMYSGAEFYFKVSFQNGHFRIDF